MPFLVDCDWDGNGYGAFFMRCPGGIFTRADR